MLDLKALLTKILWAIRSPVYFATSSNTITNTNIDTRTEGASITLPAGRSYIIVGQWTFNTGSGTSGRNMQVLIYNKSAGNVVAQHRVFAPQANWACLQAVYITDKLGADNTYVVCGSSSMTYTTASNNYIKAIPVGGGINSIKPIFCRRKVVGVC